LWSLIGNAMLRIWGFILTIGRSSGHSHIFICSCWGMGNDKVGWSDWSDLIWLAPLPGLDCFSLAPLASLWAPTELANW
jgi:hypothetical protein